VGAAVAKKNKETERSPSRLLGREQCLSGKCSLEASELLSLLYLLAVRVVENAMMFHLSIDRSFLEGVRRRLRMNKTKGNKQAPSK
jgi:hypothetical protein